MLSVNSVVEKLAKKIWELRIMINYKQHAYVLLGLLIPILGLSWPINKIGLNYITPFAFSAWRLLIGTLCMFLVVVTLKKFIWPRRQDLPMILAIGLLQMGLFMVLINIGLHYVGAGRTAVLVYTTSIWVTPIAIIFFHEQAGLFKYFGLILSIIGVLILFNPQQFDWHNRNVLIGNSALVLAAICWAIAILCARYMKWTRSPIELVPWQLLIGTIPVVILALTEKSGNIMSTNPVFLGTLAYTGILGTAFTYFSMLVISKELPSITTSLSLLGVPVCGILFSAILLHESVTLDMSIAIILILIGLVCIFLDAFFPKNVSLLRS